MTTTDRPVGPAIDWRPATPPDGRVLSGTHARIEPVDPARHAADLFDGARADAEGLMWTYLAYGPFSDLEGFRAWLTARAADRDPLFCVIADVETGRARGMASLMRMAPAMGVIEIGNIWFTPAIQRTRLATEAIYLMMAHVFNDLGYRRFEWKCDSFNAASRRAAQRFGFTYEGIFRQHMVIKGRNRDTAWFAMLDGDWPRIKGNFQRWLSADNFDAEGRQRVSLNSLNAD